jgi:Zn-dependent peptidase ImmA (M78 family)
MELHLQPNVLRWARERAGMERHALAAAMTLPDERVEEWETTGGLTFSLLQKLARVTRTPEGQLFLPTPPVENLPVPDFRTLTGQENYRASPELLDTLHDARRKQEWYREYLLSLGARPIPFVGCLSVEMAPADAAAIIREALGLQTGLRAQAANWEEALRLQISHVESHGILVLKNGVVGSSSKRKLRVEEFRGFALSDPYAPLIFLNNEDSLAAQMFTLAHELVHIGLDQSGVSNPFENGATNNPVETFCNRVAAELLVPAAELRERLKLPGHDGVGALSRHFRVSGLVMLIRLRELGLLTPADFRKLYEQEQQAFADRKGGRKPGGGNFYATELVRVGRRLARAVVESTLEGRTSYRDACRLLGVASPATVNELAKRFDLVR